jgi:hypothetical protein
MLHLLGREQKQLLLALAWTAWQDRFSVLTASLCVGTRSVPVAVSVSVKHSLARSQNLWEETFLRLTFDGLRAAGVEAVWLCDRGFHRVAWLKRLLEMELHFVVRLQRDVTAQRLRVGSLTRRRLRARPSHRHLGEGREGSLVAGDRPPEPSL